MFGGGFPFFGQPQGSPQKPVDTQAFYDVLGISKTATLIEIRKAYMVMARKEHPDKGGNEEKFKEITKAYETLINPETRALYDAHGENGCQQGSAGAGMGSAADVFAQMFKTAAFGGGGVQQRANDSVLNITVALEDVYNGKVMSMLVTREGRRRARATHACLSVCVQVLGIKLLREIPCSACKASGTVSEAAEILCNDCGGKGYTISLHRIGPIVQQIHAPCGSCRATGKKAEASDQCPTCLGKKTCPCETVLDLVIERGMKSGDKIVLAGKGPPAPQGAAPGDLIFVVQITDHDVFQRQGCEIVMQKRISLLEALTGFLFSFTHLDGTKLSVTSAAGDVIAPGDVRAFVGKGMPIRGNTFIKGDLFIKFEVAFPLPGSISEASVLALKGAIPKTGSEAPADTNTDADADVDVERGTLSAVNTEAAQERERHMRAYDEEYEEVRRQHGARPQHVQCSQQ